MEPLSYLRYLQPRSIASLSSYLSGLVEGRLWLKVLIGMALGLATGVLIGPTLGWVDPDTGTLIGTWLAFPGQLFIAIIQMIVIPLIVASIVLGLASSESQQQLKQLGLWATAFFVVMTVFAALLGLALAEWLNPGASLRGRFAAAGVAPAADQAIAGANGAPDLSRLPELAINLLPGNPLESMVEGEMLQVVLFSVIIGIAIVTLTPTQSKPLLDLLSALQQICMTVVKWAMRIAPLAVFGLMARLTSQLGLSALIGMAQYVGVVMLGLLLLGIAYLVIVRLTTGARPLIFLGHIRELLLLAFSTSSSAAVMPLSIQTAQQKLQVSAPVAQFVIPLGATINMNGTALYQSVAAVFLAQAYGIEISAAGLGFIVAMSVGASIGSPATPGVGIVILATTLGTIGIPQEGIALIMGVDRILDMSRTAVNVAGDMVACVVIDHRVGTGAEPLGKPEPAASAH
jgi:Na+/H+-dicarboxylate symporter